MAAAEASRPMVAAARTAAIRRRSWRMARWVTTMEVRSGSGSCVILDLGAMGGVLVTVRAWAGALAADLRPACGPVAAPPG
jgi:hypothetical protein